jgi:dipeptidase D
MTISNLEPSGLWGYFEKICEIPRLSKNEEKITAFLVKFAQDNGLVSRKDKAGNLLIEKPASPGYENRKPVVLQSHLDMVGEKDAETDHDWLNDGITPVIDGEWIRAEKTTLGADDGIGIAAQMEILTNKSIRTGAVECLFTVDEESGMSGAMNIEGGFFRSKILLNLDSEDEGELFIGCAGGIDTVANMKYQPASSPASAYRAFDLSVTGLLGGHSGDEIHKGFGNSVKIMNRLLLELDSRFGILLSVFNGGNLRNAIPREAFSTLVIKESDIKEFETHVREFEKKIIKELSAIDPGVKISFGETDLPAKVMDRASQEKLNMALEKCPHGAIAWSKDIEGLVETSTNLASVSFLDNNTIKIVTSQRSSVEKSKEELALRIESIFRNAGAEVVHSDGYPGWEPDTNSEILRITRESYARLFGNEPVVRAIHAGLECGLILKKVPGLDMISFGPTIKGAHTPLERINIETTVKFWKLLLDVLDNIPESN